MSAVLLCQGTALALPLRDASVHVCCTSPPYWQLRSYGIGVHHGEIGLEATPDAYIAAMVQVFREVWRVLRPEGTCWVNMGDSYASGEVGRHDGITRSLPGMSRKFAGATRQQTVLHTRLPAKNLLGLPWRLALALQADGWVLRSEIIWAKLNPMPESVQDRPTRSHEQVFLFAKQPHYFFDAQAVREPGSPNTHTRFANGGAPRTNGHKWAESHGGSRPNDWGLEQVDGRSCRSVWSLSSEPSGFQHYAAFPQALVRKCLLAGAQSQVCAQCSAPYRRVVERQPFDRTHDRLYGNGNGVGHHNPFWDCPR